MNLPPNYSGWMTTDAYMNYDCPRCGALRGTYCKYPSGRKARDIHGERRTLLIDEYGVKPWRRSTENIHDLTRILTGRADG